MKFSILQENLSKSINAVSRVVNSKPTLPILSNVLLEVTSSAVKLSATDLDIGIYTSLNAEVETEGSITVSARTFSEFINSLSSGKIDIELTGTQLTVHSQGNTASFNTIPADEFPVAISVEGNPLLTIKAVEFKKAIEQVVFSAAIDDARPALTGINFECIVNKLILVGVDGFRLSKSIININNSVEDLNLLIPAKALLEFSKILTEDVAKLEEKVELYYLKDKSQALLRYKEYDLLTRLVDAKFPDYKQIIPSGYTTRVIFDSVQLQNTVKIINIFARNVIGNKSIMDINQSEGKVCIQAAVAEVGENQSEIEVSAEGEVLVVAFSARYLNDMLSNIKSEYIVFESNGKTMPGVFKPSNAKGDVDETFLHIIMPMRLE